MSSGERVAFHLFCPLETFFLLVFQRWPEKQTHLGLMLPIYSNGCLLTI